MDVGRAHRRGGTVQVRERRRHAAPDLVPHDIVLDNGTPVGTLAPGQSSGAITLVTDTVGYRCTFHPTMVGQGDGDGGYSDDDGYLEPRQ